MNQALKRYHYEPVGVILHLAWLEGMTRKEIHDLTWSDVDFDAAMLAPGHVVRILGMRVMALGGFEAALADPHAKQVMWARLKQLPPLGEPY